MNWTDLFLNYGICVFVIVALTCTGVVFYKIGYQIGHQDGWREGLHRAYAFGRMKLLESEQNNGKRRL